MDKQMVSTFMEITACESQAYAVQHLGSCRWNLDEAINLYFNTGSSAGPSAVSALIPSEEEDDDYNDVGGDDGVRAPIPSRAEALYEDDAYYGNHDAPYIGFGEEPYPAPPVPAFHAQALSEIEGTGWGIVAEPGDTATGWGELEPGDGGHVGAEDVDGGESHDDAEQEDNSSREEDSDQGDYSDDEFDDYTLEMAEDDSSYYATIEEDDTKDAGVQPRPAQPQQQHALDALYQHPVDLMFDGSFHDAKVRAEREDRFLLVNLQTNVGAGHFQSMLHNRDLWSDEQVKNAVKESFILFLVQNKSSTNNFHYSDQCLKVCSFYRLQDDQLPAVLILNPITGELLNKWSGPMKPEEFMEYVDAYTKEKPSTMFMSKFVKRTSAPAVAASEQELSSAYALAATSCSEQEPVPAPEAEPPSEMTDDNDEPMEGEKMCKLRIRFPDGTMVPKEFGCKRMVVSLFAFCKSTLYGGGNATTEQKSFQIMRFAGRGFEAVQRDGGVTFEDLGLKCETVSVVLDS